MAVVSFRAKVQFYCRLAGKTQRDLAEQLGFSYMSLNKKLTGQRALSEQDVRGIITTLLDWQVFQSLEEVTELGELAGYPALVQSLLPSLKVENGLVVISAGVTPGKSSDASVSPPQNLPPVLTSFIGRQNELAELEKVLDQGRWVSLVGPAGCGKTRLAVEMARRILPRFSEGCWLVELAAVSEGRLITQLVANALGLKNQGGQSLEESLLQNLKDRRLLLVLDNCEHLLEPVQVLVELLLSGCQNLVIVTTSREKLGSSREKVLPVGPMPTPPTLSPGAAHPLKLKELRAYDSILLFEARARQAQSSFKLEAANVLTVQEVCQRLDGIPLALELAATRLQALSLNQIKTRLDERFRILKADTTNPGSPDLSRHQTLQALIDWSYNLLTPTEQRLFRRLSVFRGSFTLEDVEAICFEQTEAAPTLTELMNSLVNKNLVQAQADHRDEKEDIYYRLLETLREYGATQLDASEREALPLKFAQHYTELAEKADPLLRTSAAAQWTYRLEQEFANLNTALTWIITNQEAALALRLGGSLGRFWYQQGYFLQGQEWLKKVLELKILQSNDNPAGLVAKVFRSLGVLLLSTGDFFEAMDYIQQSLELYKTLGDKEETARCLNSLGVIAHQIDDLELAKIYYSKSLQLYKDLDDKVGITVISSNLGPLLIKLGDYQEAHKILLETLALRRSLGVKRGVALTLHSLAIAEYKLCNYEPAIAYAEESLTLYSELNSKASKGRILTILSRIFYWKGNYEGVFSLLEQATQLSQETGDKEALATCCLIFGQVYLAKQDYQNAQTKFLQGLELHLQADLKEGVDVILAGLGWIEMEQGELIKSLRLVSGAIKVQTIYRLFSSVDEEKEYNFHLSQLKSLVDEETFEWEWAAVQAMTLPQIFAEISAIYEIKIDSLERWTGDGKIGV